MTIVDEFRTMWIIKLFCRDDEHSPSMTPKVPRPTITCSTSNRVATMSGYRDMDPSEDGAERGVRKQKYPLDDYLIHTNMKTHTQAPLLSPLSPVSSPESVDIIQNAERLVKNAQQQIMEVSFNSALNTFDENTPSYIGQQPLDDSLISVREMVDSKFQESNDPNRIYIRQASPNKTANSNQKLQHDQFPVRESSRLINKPSEIARNSEFSTSHRTQGMSLQNEKPFFKEAPNWFNIKPPEHIAVFPTSTISNSISKTKRSGTAPCCTMTNTGVIEINGRDHSNGTIRVQTGPTVDIRRGLTIQNIENVHISPDPSSKPIYNNIATYCFQHEPSTSTSHVNPNRNNSITSSNAKSISVARKERHIESTDYNDVHEIVHIENTQNAVLKNSISHSANQEPIRMQAASSSNSNYLTNGNNGNVNCDGIGLSIVRNKKKSDDDLNVTSNSHKSLISNETHLSAQNSLRESVDSVAHLKKTVSINLTPVVTSVYQEFPIADVGVQHRNRERDFEGKTVSKGHYEISSTVESAASYVGQKCHHVQSDPDYVHLQTCSDECQTGSCSGNCERHVECKEGVKLKQTLETIANVEKVRFDIRDTGIAPAECTQVCEDKNDCNADTVSLEFIPLSQPECFKTALEELCKFSQKTRAFQINTDSKMYQKAIDAFVKMVFDLNNESNPNYGLYSPDKELKNEETAWRQNNQFMAGNGFVKIAGVQTKKEDVEKALKQVKSMPKPREVETHRQARHIVKPKVDNLSNVKNNTSDAPISQFRTGCTKQPNKYSKSLTPQNSQVQKDRIARREKVSTDLICNEEDTIENMDLKQPCISDVDTVLKSYRESMAAISQSTEQLSQLISHHIMNNTLSTPDQIPFAPIPNSSIVLGEADVEPYVTGNEQILGTRISKLVSQNTSKLAEYAVAIHQKKGRNQTLTQRTWPNQTESTKVSQQKNVQGKVRQHNYTIVSKDNAEFSSENNSVCTNETAVSTTDECSPICSRSTSEQVKTLSNINEKSSLVQLDVVNGTSNSTSTSKAFQQTSGDIRIQLDSTQPKAVENGRKSDEKQLMNIQYCIPQSFEAPISSEVKSDEKNSPSKSDLENPLSTYLRLENVCGKDIRLHRHSNYDIHSDEPEDFDLYKCPVLISDHKNNLDASDKNPNDNFIAAENVSQTEKIEMQVFGQILNAVKNSSQFMKRFFVSLFNGMEIDSINDIVRNLEDAAVHPIVIEQLLVLLKGGDGQKNYHELLDPPKTNDNINSFKDTIGFNGNVETINVHNIESDLDSATSHPAGNQKTEYLDPTHRKPFDEVSANLIHNHNSPKNRVPENESPNKKVQCEIISDKHITKEVLENHHDNLAMSKTTYENKSRLLEPSLILPRNSLRAHAVADLQETKEKLLEAGHCQSNNAKSERENDIKECLTNSSSSNAASKKIDSKSNTEKDISFIIPHDADINSGIVDLSSVQKLTSLTLKNETTGETIGFQIESNCRNGLHLNSFTQQENLKVNSKSDPGNSSILNNKSVGKLQSSNEPTLNHTNLTENLQKVDSSIICHCRRAKDQNAPKIESHNVPCESSLDAVDVLSNFPIQSNYQQLGLEDPAGLTFRHTLEKRHFMGERTLNKRARATHLSATSNSPTRKFSHQNRIGEKKNKSCNEKTNGNKTGFLDNKRRLAAGVKRPECNDQQKSDTKNPCPLCIRLEGKCSCLDCTNCNKNVGTSKKTAPKLKKGKEEFVGDVTFPTRQSGSPKRLGNTSGRYSFQKKLSPRQTPAPFQSEKNTHTKNIDYNQEVVKNDRKFIRPRTNVKPSSGISGTANQNDSELMDRKTKLKGDRKLLQDAASDSDNLRVEDKSQNTANDGDVTAARKNIQTQHTLITGEITVCKSSGTLCKKIIIPEEASLFPLRKLDEIVETNTVVEPPIKNAGTIPHLECCSLQIQTSPINYTNSYCKQITVNEEKTVRGKEMKDSSTMVPQISQICNNYKKNQFNSLETTSETETVSVLEKTCPNIFDREGILVLQPLNELDHTFFIRKPSCVESQMIQEKLNKRLNIQVRETTCPSIRESRQYHTETKKDLSYYSNDDNVEHINCIEKWAGKDILQLNSATSTINYVENKECQADYDDGKTRVKNLINNKLSNIDFASSYLTDSALRILESKEECADLCTNDEKCLRICSHPPPEIDDSRLHCKEDCPQGEVCLKFCSANLEAEPSIQISSININGILEKFITENTMPSVKLAIVRDLLQELRKVEDLLRAKNGRFETIYEKSEPQDDDDKNKIEKTGKRVEGSEPRCHPKESHRESVQYEEPHEKMEHLVKNRKSLVLPNVVRGLADMHPSKNLEHLKLRSADPVVSGNFNKPESDKRYSVFNQSDPGNSSIALNYPKMQAHLASTAQWAKVQEGEKSASDSSVDMLQSTLMKINKKPPTTGKLNTNNATKLNKSRHGMDADSEFLVRLNKKPVQLFENSDLEPGEILQVRTPFDKPIKSCQPSGQIDFQIGKVTQDQVTLNSLHSSDENHVRSLRNMENTKTLKATETEHKNLRNKNELPIPSAEADNSNNHKSYIDKVVVMPENVVPDTIKSITDESLKIIGKSDSSQKAQIIDNDERPKAVISATSISKLGFIGIKSNVLKSMQTCTTTEDFESSQIDNSRTIAKMGKGSHGILNDNENIDPLQKFSEQFCNGNECSSRPQIIDHFLGKTKLEDMKVGYTNDKSGPLSEDFQNVEDNFQRLYFKSDFTSKTIHDAEALDHSIPHSSKEYTDRDLPSSNRVTSKHWDQTSSDTHYSEGEINLPISCSYSIGEVKLSTPSSTTAGKSFKDLDGFTIFVTKSVLDSAHATCNSPGEILADIQKTESDFSSSVSS